MSIGTSRLDGYWPSRVRRGTGVVTAGHCSVTGNYREENEDACLVRSGFGIFLIADGIGGYPGGAEASEIALGSIFECFLPRVALGEVNEANLSSDLLDGIAVARERMCALARENQCLRKMGTTFSGVVIHDGYAYYARVGDCRVSLVRRGRARSITKDETFVQALVDSGQLSESLVKTHPQRHWVLNQIGIKPLDASPGVERVRLRAGDRLILTTDGVSDKLTNLQIFDVLRESNHPQTNADRLVEKAIEEGSRDNVSCVVVRCGR